MNTGSTEHPTDFSIREAHDHDLEDVLCVQRDGFGRVAAGLGIAPALLPPLTETAADLRALHERGARFFVAIAPDGRVVGTVRALEVEAGVEVGRLAVASGWQRRGVASALMGALEAAYPDAARFVLFTGAEAHAPLALYDTLGYRVFRRETHPHVELVWLEKLRRGE